MLPHQAPTAASSETGAVKRPQLTGDTNWCNLHGRKPIGWHGYAGEWGIYAPDPANGPNAVKPVRQWQGARLTLNDGSNRFEERQVWSERMGTVVPMQQRPQDRHWTKSAVYEHGHSSLWDGRWDSRDLKEGPMRARTAAATPDHRVMLNLALPLEDFMTADHPQPPPFWIFEVPLRLAASGRAWSGGATYGVSDQEMKAMTYIREVQCHDDPSGPVQLQGRLDMWPPGPLLPADPEEWLQGSDWTGSSLELTWDFAGETMAVKTSQHTAGSRPQLQPGNTLSLLPDSLYVSVPAKLPATASGIPECGICMEFGGLMDERIFRRGVLTYGADGRIGSVRWDDYVRDEGAFWDSL